MYYRKIVSRSAFSLMEIMVVIVIIGLLAGVVTVNVRNYLIKAKQNAARQEIATIVGALNTFYTSYSRYPNHDEGLRVLVQASEKFPEPIIDGKLTDPWSRPYQYISPGRMGPFEVICYGADGREGGEGADADISSDHLKE